MLRAHCAGYGGFVARRRFSSCPGVRHVWLLQSGGVAFPLGTWERSIKKGIVVAVLAVKFGISASFVDGKNVNRDDFIGKLNGLELLGEDSVGYDRGVDFSSVVVFFNKDAPSHKYIEKYSEFELEVEEKIKDFSKWLSLQSDNVFKSLKMSGLNVFVFVEYWISVNQVDMVFPSVLTKECGRLGLDVVVTTDA